jgi:hypothetical protein
VTVQSVAPWRKTAKKARLCSGWTLHVVAGGTPARFGRSGCRACGRGSVALLSGPSGAAVTEGVVTVQSTSNHLSFTHGEAP